MNSMGNKYTGLPSILTLCACMFLGGCSRAYWVDRSRDLGDCVTLTLGWNIGVDATAGLVSVAFIQSLDVMGYRNGSQMQSLMSGITSKTFVFPIADSMPFVISDSGKFGFASLPTRTSLGKYNFPQAYYVYHYPCYGQLVIDDDDNPQGLCANQYYTQIELAAGFIIGGRIGLNPGEMLDLLVGFVNCDLYHDDVYPYKTLREKLLAQADAQHQE